MTKDYNNELLNDCSWFAEKHRGKNKQSGPHWSTIIRFTKLFDEAEKLDNVNKKQAAEIEKLKKQKEFLKEALDKIIIQHERKFFVLAEPPPNVIARWALEQVWKLERAWELEQTDDNRRT